LAGQNNIAARRNTIPGTSGTNRVQRGKMMQTNPDDAAKRPPASVAVWLFTCCAVVFAIVVVGGITRLTHSGLSIVEWQPIVGTVPPLTDQAWADAFGKYQQTPEYRQINAGMSLPEFKNIFWWEYVHRLLGRSAGVIFLLPFLYFIARRMIDRPFGVRLFGIFLLGGVQGVLGWYMVKSGLADVPRVSPFRLTAHLGLAFLLYAAMLWTALDVLAPPGRAATDSKSPPRRFALVLGAIFVAALSGAMVAGTRAGLAYNTFPLMNGRWMPPEILMLDPWWDNFFHNLATVQFDHRVMALLLAILILWFCWSSWHAVPARRVRFACALLVAALALQVALGIATLLLAVPIALAAAHQAGALLLLTAALVLVHEL
jgi:cytochrome c oxidase assembly protein subunit 15